ncbi:hypothetical protein [Microcoleus sp. CAWBG640]|uniref:hypothetical protein n=1 Tax=Microcoleus sp. CAWBG640 TaxID=2841653 RepID=UPI00312B2AE6
MLSKNLLTFSLITLSYIGSVGVLSTLTTGCDLIKQDKSLSASKAERMVNKWKKSDGTIKVAGVRENQNNTAVATLQVSDLKIKTEQREVNYSGAGEATFSRYTDGSWALTGLVFSNGGLENIFNTFTVSNLNIKDD